LLVDPFHLEENLARLDDGDPGLRRSLPLAHARFGRLLRDRLVGEEADPDLSASLDEAGDRDARGLDLPRGDPAVLEGLQSEVAERDRAASVGHARPPSALLLPELDLARH